MLERLRKEKNPHAVELGRRGGRVGGKARAARLSPERRREIARDAALARWRKPVRIANAHPRDASATRERILVAARRELVMRGLHRGRVDRIAAAAGVNKRMIYYYFGSKQGLFRELLKRSLTALTEMTAATLAEWQKVFVDRPYWTRLSMWEALGGPPFGSMKERREFWSKAVDGVREAQDRGEVPTLGDPAQMQLTLIAVVMFPFLLPQFAQFVTGFNATSPQFLEQRAEHLRALEAFLTDSRRTPPS